MVVVALIYDPKLVVAVINSSRFKTAERLDAQLVVQDDRAVDAPYALQLTRDVTFG